MLGRDCVKVKGCVSGTTLFFVTTGTDSTGKEVSFEILVFRGQVTKAPELGVTALAQRANTSEHHYLTQYTKSTYL